MTWLAWLLLLRARAVAAYYAALVRQHEDTNDPEKVRRARAAAAWRN